MKRIMYAGGVFSTDDAVADALMQYASALAIVNSADVIDLPGVDEQGTVREFTLTIGPASQILSVASDDAAVELHSGEAVKDLRSRARRRLPDSLGIAEAGMALPAETDAESTSHESAG